MAVVNLHDWLEHATLNDFFSGLDEALWADAARSLCILGSLFVSHGGALADSKAGRTTPNCEALHNLFADAERDIKGLIELVSSASSGPGALEHMHGETRSRSSSDTSSTTTSSFASESAEGDTPEAPKARTFFDAPPGLGSPRQVAETRIRPCAVVVPQGSVGPAYVRTSLTPELSVDAPRPAPAAGEAVAPHVHSYDSATSSCPGPMAHPAEHQLAHRAPGTVWPPTMGFEAPPTPKAILQVAEDDAEELHGDDAEHFYIGDEEVSPIAESVCLEAEQFYIGDDDSFEADSLSDSQFEGVGGGIAAAVDAIDGNVESDDGSGMDISSIGGLDEDDDGGGLDGGGMHSRFSNRFWELSALGLGGGSRKGSPINEAPTTFPRGQSATSAPVTPATSDVASWQPWQAKALAPPQRGGGDNASNKARPGQVNGTSSDPSAVGRRASAIGSADLGGSACEDALGPSLSCKSSSHAVSNDRYGRAVGSDGGCCEDSDIQEVRTTDGRTGRVLKDVGHEVEFAGRRCRLIYIDGRKTRLHELTGLCNLPEAAAFGGSSWSHLGA